jgi:hypothetical protein
MAALFHGHTTVATPGTAVALAAGTSPVTASWISFWPRKADGSSNSDEVRVGGVPLDADAGAIPPGNGMPLGAGDAGVAWPQWGYDLRTVYVDADAAGDGVSWVYGVA